MKRYSKSMAQTAYFLTLSRKNNYLRSHMNVKSSLTAICLLSAFSLSASAAPAVVSTDYSGEYLCKGNNIAVGDYEVTIYLKKNRRNSTSQIAVYDLATHTENKQSYTGQTITRGKQLAMTFKLSDAKFAEFSTGLGQFTKAGKLWSFKNDYYEPDDTGGNYGHEICTQKPILLSAPANGKIPVTNR
jgi:hypothetical protein